MDSSNHVDLYLIKEQLKTLENARGNGTSLISLMLPPGYQIPRIQQTLTNEHGTSMNIKKRVNRLSVQTAIASIQSKLSTYKQEMLNDDPKIGFIIMDGNGCLFGLVQGNHREVLHNFLVSLPKKHGRGGQSAVRFARLRLESRHNYIRKVSEVASSIFIENDQVNISSLILAGIADFKNELGSSNIFDSRLQSKILKTVDIAYGGMNGFHQAIELSSDVLSDVRLIQEKQIIAKYFDEINKDDSGKYIYGVTETVSALEAGCVGKLICWEGLDSIRQILQDKNGDQKVKCVKKGTEPTENMKIIEETSLLEWIVKEHKNYGASLELVSDKSQEGTQFVHGFGGIGAILRYAVNFEPTLEDEFEEINLEDY